MISADVDGGPGSLSLYINKIKLCAVHSGQFILLAMPKGIACSLLHVSELEPTMVYCSKKKYCTTNSF